MCCWTTQGWIRNKPCAPQKLAVQGVLATAAAHHWFYCFEKIARADSALFKCDTDMTHVFSVVFIHLLYLLKTKHVLSAEWKLQILADRRKLQVALEQGSKGHSRKAAVSDCNLEMWVTQLACPSVSCWMTLIYQATVRQASKQYFPLLTQYCEVRLWVTHHGGIDGNLSLPVHITVGFSSFWKQKRNMSTVVLKTTDFYFLHSQLIFVFVFWIMVLQIWK